MKKINSFLSGFSLIALGAILSSACSSDTTTPVQRSTTKKTTTETTKYGATGGSSQNSTAQTTSTSTQTQSAASAYGNATNSPFGAPATTTTGTTNDNNANIDKLGAIFGGIGKAVGNVFSSDSSSSSSSTPDTSSTEEPSAPADTSSGLSVTVSGTTYKLTNAGQYSVYGTVINNSVTEGFKLQGIAKAACRFLIVRADMNSAGSSCGFEPQFIIEYNASNSTGITEYVTSASCTLVSTTGFLHQANYKTWASASQRPIGNAVNPSNCSDLASNGWTKLNLAGIATVGDISSSSGGSNPGVMISIW